MAEERLEDTVECPDAEREIEREQALPDSDAAGQAESEFPQDPGVSDAEGAEENSGSEIELLKAEIEQLKHDAAAARADLFNYRQRVERDRVRSRKLIAEEKVIEFLPVLDNLDRALCVPEDGAAKDVLTGVRMVRRQFLSVLENSDITVIPTEESPFDPALHDAVETEYVEDPSLDGVILNELQRGYRTPERVLRAAQVRVGKLQQ